MNPIANFSPLPMKDFDQSFPFLLLGSYSTTPALGPSYICLLIIFKDWCIPVAGPLYKQFPFLHIYYDLPCVLPLLVPSGSTQGNFLFFSLTILSDSTRLFLSHQLNWLFTFFNRTQNSLHNHAPKINVLFSHPPIPNPVHSPLCSQPAIHVLVAPWLKCVFIASENQKIFLTLLWNKRQVLLTQDQTKKLNWKNTF